MWHFHAQILQCLLSCLQSLQTSGNRPGRLYVESPIVPWTISLAWIKHPQLSSPDQCPGRGCYFGLAFSRVFSLFSSASIAPLTMTLLGRSPAGADKLNYSVHRRLLITALLRNVSGCSANYYPMAVSDNAHMNDVQVKCHQNTANSDSEHVFY